MAKESAAVQQTTAEPVEVITPEAMGLRDTDIQLFKRAQFLSRSSIIPEIYQNNPANCFIVVEMAHRMGLSPMFVMNGLYIVHGRPAWASKALIQLAKSTVLKDLTYVLDKSDPDNWKIRAHAVTKEGRHVEGPEISMKLAKDMGWWTKNPIWRNATELMMRYRAAAWLINTEFPECSQGLLTKEEMDDFEPGDAKPRYGQKIAPQSLDELAEKVISK